MGILVIISVVIDLVWVIKIADWNDESPLSTGESSIGKWKKIVIVLTW